MYTKFIKERKLNTPTLALLMNEFHCKMIVHFARFHEKIFYWQRDSNPRPSGSCLLAYLLTGINLFSKVNCVFHLHSTRGCPVWETGFEELMELLKRQADTLEELTVITPMTNVQANRFLNFKLPQRS